MKGEVIPGESPADRKRRRAMERYYARRDEFIAKNKAAYQANKEARRIQGRAWHEANREKANAGRKARYYADHDGNKAKLRDSYRKFREKRNAENKADYYANRDKYIALRKANAQANPEREKASHARNHFAMRMTKPHWYMLYHARERAKKKNVPFTLTQEWADSVWTGRCAVTGIEFSLGLRGRGPKVFSPSLDRIIPSLGYTPENCRFVLWAVNALKHDGTDADMIMVAKAIAARYP